MPETEGHIEWIAFARMVDQERQGENKQKEQDFDYGEQQHWDDLYRRRVNRDNHTVHEVRRLAWDDWYT